MLNEIREGRISFIKSNNIFPETVYLSKEDMRELQNDLRDMTLKDREKDLKERLCPELLPPKREVPEITEGCMIRGMTIIESAIPGPYFGHR